MAHLGSKSTDGTLAFVKYVTKNPNWNNKKEYVIENKIQNEPVFDTRGKIVGTMSAGDPLRITEKKALRKRMMGDNKQLDYAKIKFGPSFREN